MLDFILRRLLFHQACSIADVLVSTYKDVLMVVFDDPPEQEGIQFMPVPHDDDNDTIGFKGD